MHEVEHGLKTWKCEEKRLISNFASQAVFDGIFAGVKKWPDLCDPNQIAEMFKFIQQKYPRSPDILAHISNITHTHTHEQEYNM